MATIGKIALILEAQHEQFKKGCKESVSAIHEVGESAEQLKHVIEGAFAFVGIEAGAGQIKEMVMHTVEATTEAYRLSGALGITTASLQALQTAGLLGAGIKAEEFNGILQKMVKALGTAEGGTGPAAEALTKLGLAGGALKGARVDEAFEKIADKIKDIKDPIEQGRRAVELFGREGQRLLPMFREGSEGIRAAREENDKLGISLSEVDAAKVVAAHEAMTKVGLAVDGVENKFTVALAPILTVVAEKIVSLVPAATTMQSGIMTALKVVTEGVGYVIDAWHVLQLAGQGVSWALVGGIELVTKSVQLLAEGVVWVANKLGAGWKVPEWMNNVQNTVDDWRKQIQSDMADTVNGLAHPESQKWGDYFDQIQADADKAAQHMAGVKPMEPITADFEENANKISSIMDKIRGDAEKIGGAALPLFDLANLDATQNGIAEIEKSAIDAVNDVKQQLANIAPATAAKLIDLDNLHDAVDALAAANATVSDAQQKQQAAADRLKSDLPNSPARLVDLDTLNAANDALTTARSKADGLANSIAEQYSRVHDAAEKLGDPKALIDINNLGQAISKLTEVGATADDLFAQQNDLLNKLKQDIANIGKPKELIDLENLHASAAVLAQAKASLDILAQLNQQKKVAEEIAKLQIEAAQAGMTAAEKQVDNLRRLGADDNQVKQANELQKRIDDMQAWKKEQEDANKLIEESMSPIDKYQKQLDNIQKLYHDGLLTEAQADDALAKAVKDIDKDDKTDKHVGAETRRFDFKLPNDPQKQDRAAEALAVAKQNLDLQTQIKFYQEQQYNFALNDQQNQDEIVDF